MSFTDDYLEAKKKKKKTTAAKTGHSFTDEYLSEREKSQALMEDIAPVRTAPVKTTTKKEDEERTWFSKGAFEDGYDAGDITKTIIGTTSDILEELGTGVLGMGERVVDAGAYVAGGVGKMFGNDDFAYRTQKFITKDLYDERKVAQSILSGGMADEFSVLGEKSDALVQSAGQLLGTAGLQMVGVPWFVTTGLTSFGGEVEGAFNEGASYGEAGVSAAITAGAEMLTEKISGGISFGGKTLDDTLTKNIARNISNKTVRTLSKLGVDMFGEGAEEVLSGVMSAIGQKITYADDKELKELFSKEDAFESFVGGAVLGFGSSSINAVKSKVNGVDYASGLTANEQKVVDKVYEDLVKEAEKNGKITDKEKSKIYDEVLSEMEKGGISTDTIEEVLGGDTFKNYQNAVKNEDSLRETFNQLNQMKQGDMTGEQIDLRNELKEQLKELESKGERNQLKSQLGNEVMSLVQGDRLIESYNERSRRGQAFTADLTKYNEKQKAVIQKAIDSGILNNTRRTHEFVDMVSKISADKGVLFDFANNAKLKESGFAVEGKTVNGFVTKDGVTLNIDSAKSLNSVVGHEITHVLEGTELYTALQSAVVEYAKTKGEYDSRRTSLSELYKDIKGADIDGELTADLVGDYLFTDPDFINNLSANRNVFQKIYDEIKYLCKIATAGSKEARELEKVKRAFEKAYKEGGKVSDTKYSFSDLDYDRGFALDLFVKYGKEEPGMFKEEALGLEYDSNASDDFIEEVRRFDAKTASDAEIRSMGEKLLDFYDQNNEPFTWYGIDLNRADSLNGQRYKDADSIIPALQSVYKKIGDYVPSEYNDEHYVRAWVQLDGQRILDEGATNFLYGEAIPEENRTKVNELVKNAIDLENRLQVAQEPKVKYSVSDSDGKQLTKEQQEYFKDSKVRDENGNLRVVYHSTDADFTVFDVNKELYGELYYFAASRAWSKNYFKETKYHNPKNTMRAYLNITNPLDLRSADAMTGNEWIEYFDSIGVPISEEFRSFWSAPQKNKKEYGKGTIPAWGLIRYDGVSGGLRESLVSAGYDGLVIYDTIRGRVDNTAYVCFEKNQIKRTDNKKPTADPDIRYSLSEDSEGRKLSPAVQKRFANSKAVDENGNLKVLYHGTYAGEFSIFDKSKGYVEDDFGSGFYFSDNEADVADHYEGGGPDYENKVARLAERIADEEDIDYDEAEERAREQLHNGSHKFEVYLNIENPAIVGETILFDGESINEQYNEEDYDDYDDYLEDLDQAFAEEIENLLWDVERNVDVDDLEGVSGIIYDAYAEGGIGIEELKAKINELYLEDGEGNLVGNEVTRQIIESLGYDAVVDPTVSSKWNMDIEEGTTHYIVFKPNQIKAVTNENPTDNPDIHRSLSAKGEAPVYGKYNVYGKDIALEQKSAPVQEEAVAENATTMFPDDIAPMDDAYEEDRIASLDDANAPPEMKAPYSESNEVTVDDPFEDRDWYDVGNRKVNAYMYENPEVKPFFQAEARVLLGELRDTTKGEKWYNDKLYYESGGEEGWGGTKRHTSDSIAEMLDSWKLSYADIEKGLNAIIEDNGAENIAVAKRIEFMLNERLLNGYQDFNFGHEVPPDQDYINLLNEKQVTEYSKEAFDSFMAYADSYAPPISEEIVEEIAPAKPKVEAPKRMAFEAIKPKNEKQPRLVRATPEEQATASVLTEEPKVDKKKTSAWSMIKNNVLDKGMIFEDLSLATGNRELQARWNTIRYADGKAQRFMEKNLKPIIETVEKSGKTAQFYEYLYHMHNADRMSLEFRYDDIPNKPVFGDAVTSKVSVDAARRLEKANPEFKQWAQDVYNYNRQNRELLVEGGVISREVADLWEEMYPHYVPIRRVGDDGLNINVPLDTGRTGVNAPIKRATGGNRDILPLFDTMGQRTMQTYKAVAKNRFGVELKNTLGVPTENAALGLDEAIDSVDTQDSLLQEGKNGKKPTFTVFENGEKVTFEITDEMYDAMKPKSKGMAYTNKALNVANNIRRGLLTEYNPTFWLTNAIKDSQDVVMNSQHPAKTYANYPKAILELRRKGHWYHEYMDNGGEQNTYFESDTNTFAKDKSAFKKAVGYFPDKISDANNFIERVPRLAEYIASRKAGRSIDVAMLDAARVTTNFAAGGDLTKFLNRNGTTFLNASVQGAMQQVRNVREAKANGLKGAMTLMAKLAAAGLPSILLNHLLWDDDEEYAELSDYVKQNYYIVGKYDDGKFVRIPKGRALAVIQNGFEQMENLITGNDEADIATFGELLISNLAPNNPLDNNIFAPIGQALSNTTWYGEDLVPTRLQDLPAAEQYDETTDEISKWLGEKAGEMGIDISPYKLNYLLDQYSGGVGDTFLPMITPEAERGDNTLIAPIVDKFTTDSVLKNQNISDFYDTKDELAMNAKMSNATDEDILKSKYMNSVNAELSKLYAEKRKIQNSDMSDEEKYAEVRMIQSQIVDIARDGLNSYEDVNIDGVYATVGDVQYRWYEPSEDSKAEPEWKKLTAEQIEKQDKVTRGLGIDASEYWSNKEEYDFAYEKPEKYAVAKSVGGYESYTGYSKALNDIKGVDNDGDGRSDTGTRKEKVIEWVNNLDADYGTKIILFKNEYNADDTYNYDIIEYLNNRQDISYDDMVTILKELGFDVSADGTISWD